MLKKDRALFIESFLNKKYPKPPIPLVHKNNFEFLIAVLLSAQCTDERVNRITPILFAKANNSFKMAKLSIQNIYDIIKPCGLGPKKSRAISELSKILVKNYKGNIPNNIKNLEELPGVGHKTASVIMSQGFGHPAFPVDTHIHRLAQRWKLTNGKNVNQTEKDLKKIFPKESWNKLHLQIIFYGREFCKARDCFGLKCHICKTCFPNRRKKIKTKK
mgnify:CR=1 FL=1|tara:strand:- start:755 stop:1405 length:651 start_codon:yes stop_codon:yes gene_type:complete